MKDDDKKEDVLKCWCVSSRIKITMVADQHYLYFCVISNCAFCLQLSKPHLNMVMCTPRPTELSHSWSNEVTTPSSNRKICSVSESHSFTHFIVKIKVNNVVYQQSYLVQEERVLLGFTGLSFDSEQASHLVLCVEKNLMNKITYFCSVGDVFKK